MFFKSNISNFSKATLILENGDIFPCLGIGSKPDYWELCFNTAMTGYQEAISDPYASQILMFTFPIYRITGVNNEDIENKNIFEWVYLENYLIIIQIGDH